MQELYAQQVRDGVNDKTDPVENVQKQLEQCQQLFAYLLYFLTEVARYAETDAKLRASKNLPSKDDRNVNTKISGNQLLRQILETETYKKENKTSTIEFPDTKELAKKIYSL